ncbi:MAG: carbon-nitrogen hydrolase family protein, partial [Rhodothermales bacterium]|nr:carbon-nitrogen hydrolase family protein [Rhodothermales bacterium]
MKLALIQHRASSDDEANVQRALIAVRDAAASGAQVIAFPELAFTRFFPQHRRGERDRFLHSHEIPGPLVRKFQDLAAELGVVIVLNLFERDGDRTFDSSPVIDSDGRLLGVTRMMHITHYEGFWEQDYYDPGDTGAPVFETAFGRIGVAICYDRHYP